MEYFEVNLSIFWLKANFYALNPFCFGDSSRIFYPSSSPFCSASSEAKTYRSEDADLHTGSNETYCFCITWFPFLSKNSRKSLDVKFSFFIKNCITSGKNRGKCRPSCFCSFRISGDLYIFSLGEDGLERGLSQGGAFSIYYTAVK